MLRKEKIVLIGAMVLVVGLNSCAPQKTTGTKESVDSDTLTDQQDTHSTISTETIWDTSVDSNSLSPEIVNSLQSRDVSVYSFDVDNGDIYLGVETHIYKSKIFDTSSITDAENRFYALPANPPTTIYERDNILMLAWTPHVIKYARSSETFELIEVPTEISSKLHAMAADQDRFYFTSTGCEKIVSMKRDGTDPIQSVQEITGSTSGRAYIAVGEKYVYCSGGSGGSTSGRLYRCPKEGGALEEIAKIKWADDFLGLQVGPMMEINGYLYYLVHDSMRSALYTELNRIDSNSGVAQNLFTSTLGAPGYRMLHDQERHKLYWVEMSVSSIISFDLDTNNFSRININAIAGELAIATLAHDNDYLYWITMHSHSIYRMKKF